MTLISHVRPIEILLVEDNEGDVYLTNRAFKDAKIINNLHVAMDGEEAMSILNKLPPFENHVTPDLILLDINLPKLNGSEVLERIKSTEELKRIPVIVLSGSDSEEDIQEMYGLHANSYITKPIDLAQFSEVAQSIEEFWLGIVKLPTE